MAGFFKKLLGKKEQEVASSDDGGSWAEHEVSVEIQEQLDEQTATEKSPEAGKPVKQLTESQSTSDTQTATTAIEATSELPVIQPEIKPPFNDTIEMEVTQPGPPQVLPNYQQHRDFSTTTSKSAVSATDVVDKASVKPIKQKQDVGAQDIATIKDSDLKFAMDQVEPVEELDPLAEITAQIQSELAAEKTQIEKKETLDKLIEITSKLKAPDFDEDFEV